ncbi:MAG: response regulator [Pseudomonadota bacterium]
MSAESIHVKPLIFLKEKIKHYTYAYSIKSLFTNLPFSTQLTTFFFLITSSVAVLLSVSLIIISNNILEEHGVRNGHYITHSLAKQSSLALLYGSEDAARDVVASILTFANVQQVALIDRKSKHILFQHGKIVKWEVRPLPNAVKPSELISHLESATSDYWEFSSLVFIGGEENDNFTHSKPEILGEVRVVISKNDIKQIILVIIFADIIITMILAVLLFALLRKMIRSFSKPIHNLSAAMHEVKGGRQGLRVEEAGPREFKLISREFNRMMTALEEREAELIHAKDLALDANRMKSEFIANVTHEIRTPLNGILGMLDLIDESHFTEREKSFLTDARKSGEALVNLVNEILDFSKLSAEKSTLDLETLDFRELLESRIMLYSSIEGKEHIQLSCSYDPVAPRLIRGDSVKLQQLFNNLLSNAIKFTSKGEVYIETFLDKIEDNKVTLKIYVHDTGIGIKTEFISKLFDPYLQQDGSISRQFGGTGLGLAICKKLAEIMNGSIRVVSEEHIGSSFEVKLTFDSVEQIHIQPKLTPFFESGIGICSNDTLTKPLSNFFKQFSIPFIHIYSENIEEQLMPTLEKSGRTLILVNVYEISDFELDLFKSVKNLYRVTLVCFKSRHQSDNNEKYFWDLVVTRPTRTSYLEDRLLAHLTTQNSNSFGVMSESNAKKHSEDINNNTGKCVLVVEDNVVNSRIAKANLEKLGFEVDVAMNGAEGLTAASNKKYDLILMDCQMPIMDGFAATQKIRQLAAPLNAVPIVAVTANNSPEDQRKCAEAGMDGFISKPYTRDMLKITLQKWIKNSDSNLST